MRGSRVVSRPPRQARTGVTYKETDEDDEQFVSNSARVPASDVVARRSSLRNGVTEAEGELGIAKGKRTLTLKRARTTLEPPVRVENESVSVQEALSPGHGRQFHQVFESAEGMRNPLSSAFECLLEAVSGASGDGEDEGTSVSQHFSAPKTAENTTDQEEEMTSAAYATFERKLPAVKGVKGEDTKGTNALRRLAHSSDEENGLANSNIGKGMNDTMDRERVKRSEQDGISSADEKKYYRRGERDKQNSMSSGDGKKGSKTMEEERAESVSFANRKKDSTKNEEDILESVSCANGKNDSTKNEEDMLESVPCAYGKEDSKGDEDKQDNVSSAAEDDEDAEDSWNESSDASDAENKKPVKGKRNIPSPAKNPCQELKTFVKKNKVTKPDPGTPGRVLVPANSTSVPSLLPKKRPALWVGTKPFVPPGPLNLPSPIVAHRRVVGLSRRHRPPPLHPYLLES